ncbi:MAG: hypothetical protein DMG57_15665 [Acidobacteria bacterium]|nr:MAG: hypothetical protein DMG57_15665 [Acidobacteriota bacterium]
MFGRSHLGTIQGCAQMLTVFASAVGPLLLAETLRQTGSFNLIFHVLAVKRCGAGHRLLVGCPFLSRDAKSKCPSMRSNQRTKRMKIRLLATNLLLFLFAGCVRKPSIDTQTGLEQKFQQMMSGVTLIGHSASLKGESMSGEEKYVIEKV